VVAALKSEGLLNESVGAGYIDRNWPPALKESGAWPLASLRQSFLNGTLTRLLDVDAVLRRQVIGFVERGDFGLASGLNPDGTYQRVWFGEVIGPEEVSFDANVFLLTKQRAQALTQDTATPAGDEDEEKPGLTLVHPPGVQPTGQPIATVDEPVTGTECATVKLTGTVPAELWNRLGTKIVPKLRSCDDLGIEIAISATVPADALQALEAELRQALADLGISDQIRVERG